jgi:hypothetical protein
MSWIYSQSTGYIIQNGSGQCLGQGYSGYGGCCNIPDLEHLHNEGPIPRGWYRIGRAEYNPSTGPYSMRLTPVGHHALGRTKFLIHGDSRQLPGGASHGCIVLPLDIRKKIDESGDTDLQVIR